MYSSMNYLKESVMGIKYLAHELCLFYMIFNADWNIDSEHVIPLIRGLLDESFQMLPERWL